MAVGRKRVEGGTLIVKQLLRLPCQLAILCSIFFSEPQRQDGFEQVEDGKGM